MRLWETGVGVRRWHFGLPLRTRRMTARERSSSISVCQTCGAKVEHSGIYCVPCAINYADADVAYFDRWVLIFIWIAAGVVLSGAVYYVLRFFNVGF